MTVDVARLTYQGTIRTAAILTTSYVEADLIPNKVIGIDNLSEINQLRIDVDFTIGSLTSAEIKIETAMEEDDFYQSVAEEAASPSSGVSTITPGVEVIELTTDFKGTFFRNLSGRYVKVSVKGTGTVTSSSMQLKAAYGRNQT